VRGTDAERLHRKRTNRRPGRPHIGRHHNRGVRTTASGIDFDLIDLVANRLGVTRQVVKAGIDDGSGLAAGRCDITSGQLISASRNAVMDLSFAYFVYRLGLLVKKGAAIRTLDQFRNTNVRLGVQRGDRGESETQKRGIAPDVFPDEDTLLVLLSADDVGTDRPWPSQPSCVVSTRLLTSLRPAGEATREALVSRLRLTSRGFQAVHSSRRTSQRPVPRMPTFDARAEPGPLPPRADDRRCGSAKLPT
jgi:hypothetical protein